MNNSAYWLELLEKENKGLSNNQALAEALGLSRASISHQKRGLYAMGVRAAVQVAYMLELHPMLIIASTQYDSATTELEKVFWLSTYLKWQDKAPRTVKPPITEQLPEPT